MKRIHACGVNQVGATIAVTPLHALYQSALACGTNDSKWEYRDLTLTYVLHPKSD